MKEILYKWEQDWWKNSLFTRSWIDERILAWKEDRWIKGILLKWKLLLMKQSS